MDINKFKKMDYERRTARVKIPAVSFLFADGEPPELVVQNLTGFEVAKAKQRIIANRALGELVSKLASDSSSAKVEAVFEALGLSDDVPGDHAYRLAVFEFGVQSVDFDQESSVKFAENHPLEFNLITSKILELTGMGASPSGESIASGTIRE